MEQTPPDEAAAQVWRAVLLTYQAQQATRAAGATLAAHPETEHHAQMREDVEALAEQTAPAARRAEELSHRYLALNGEHAEIYARDVAARAFALAVEMEAVAAECDDEDPDDLDFTWHREKVTAAAVMLARAAERQRATHYHQAQVGRAAAARVARLKSDPAYAARRAARERARFAEPEEVAAEVEAARVSGAEPSAYAAELARVHEVTTRQGWDGYRPEQDPEAVADEETTTAPARAPQ